MSDITLSATVTRAGLSLTPLELNDGEVYVLMRNLGIDDVSWSHVEARSPFVHGRVVVHSTKDPAETTVGVYVRGSNAAAVRSNLDTVVKAFTEQSEYDLTMVVDGQTYAWTCERADFRAGFVTEYLAALKVPVLFTFMRHPVPVSGPI